jgi:hypothetical protein
MTQRGQLTMFCVLKMALCPAVTINSLSVSTRDDKDLHVDEVIAQASDFFSASSAYDEAEKRRPGKLITLRQKARVIKKSR